MTTGEPVGLLFAITTPDESSPAVVGTPLGLLLALTVADSSGVTLKDSGVANPGINSFSTASFTTANNSLLVVMLGVVDDGAGDVSSTLTIADNLGTHLTYTSAVADGNSGFWKAQSRVWVAPVVTGAALTLTFDCGSSALYSAGWFVFEVTGYDPASPVGGVVGSSNDTTDGAISVTLSAAPAAGDVTLAMVWLDGDFSGTIAVTPGADFTEVGEIGSTTVTAYGQAQTRTGSTSTSVSWADIRAGSMPTYSSSETGIVIKAASGGGGVDASAVFTVGTGTASGLTLTATATTVASLGVVGALSISGSVARLLSAVRAVDGVLNISGAVTRLLSISKLISGTLATSGAVTRTASLFRAVQGALISTGTMVAKLTGKSLGGALDTAGNVSKGILKQVQGVLISAGQMFTSGGLAMFLDGALSLSGAIAKNTTASVSGAVGFTGRTLKQISTRLAGVLNSFGIASASQLLAQIISGALGISGAVVKQANKTLQGALSATGVVAKAITHIVQGVLNIAGAVRGGSAMVIGGVLVSVGSIRKSTRYQLAGALINAGGLSKTTTRLMGGVVTFAGLIIKGTGKTLSGTLLSVGQITGYIAGLFSAMGNALFRGMWRGIGKRKDR